MLNNIIILHVLLNKLFEIFYMESVLKCCRASDTRESTQNPKIRSLFEASRPKTSTYLMILLIVNSLHKTMVEFMNKFE